MDSRRELAREGGALFRIHSLGGAGGADFAEQKIAALLAMTTRLGANAAMIVQVGVGFAFIGADAAGENARVELGMHEIAGRFGLAREDAQRGRANVGAIEIRADATAELLEMFGLTEAGVGAGRAGIDAGAERADGFGVKPDALLVGAGVVAEHKFDRFHVKKGAVSAMRQRLPGG